jgi:hypothetical protein
MDHVAAVTEAGHRTGSYARASAEAIARYQRKGGRR